MSNANTIKRQVGGSTVGTLAPIVNPSTTQTQFTFNPGPLTPANSWEFSPSHPSADTINTGYLMGGVIPLSTGVLNTFSLYQQAPGELILNGNLGEAFTGQGVQGANFYQGTGQVIHIAATGKFAGLTANSTTISLSLWEIPAAFIQAGGLTATSFVGYNEVTATSAEEVTTASGVFTFDVFIQLDAAGNLNGYYQAQIGTNVIPPTVISGDVTGLVGELDLNFVLAATLGTSAPSTAVLTVDELRIDLE